MNIAASPNNEILQISLQQNQPDALISQIYFDMKLHMFPAVPLPIIRSLFTVHSTTVYVMQVCRQLSSRTESNVYANW
jgi:hypothetical protein